MAVHFAAVLATLEEEAQRHTGDLPSPSGLRTALQEQLILLTGAPWHIPVGVDIV